MDSSVEFYRLLENEFKRMALHRPMKIERYEAGTELEYAVTGVETANQAKVHLAIEKFIGGGFAGQVYRVKVLQISTEDAAIDHLEVGGIYAVKILIPPSGFSRLFRNALYWLGFQGPFQLQVNPAVQDDALKGYEQKVVPTVKSKKGFRGLYVLTNRKTGTWLTIGLWDSEADALADEQDGHYKERVDMGREIFTAPPVVEGYDVSINM